MKVVGCGKLLRTFETGMWYRAIQPQHWTTALATNQTKVITSRFSEGVNAKTQIDILYLSENHSVALFEVEALYGTPNNPLPNPAQAWILLNVEVQLQKVADLTGTTEHRLLATTAQELTGDWRGYHLRKSSISSVLPSIGHAPTQELGAALFAMQDLEGFYAISAKIPTQRNLIIFPEKLQKGSKITFHDKGSGKKHVITP